MFTANGTSAGGTGQIFLSSDNDEWVLETNTGQIPDSATEATVRFTTDNIGGGISTTAAFDSVSFEVGLSLIHI